MRRLLRSAGWLAVLPACLFWTALNGEYALELVDADWPDCAPLELEAFDRMVREGRGEGVTVGPLVLEWCGGGYGATLCDGDVEQVTWSLDTAPTGSNQSEVEAVLGFRGPDTEGTPCEGEAQFLGVRVDR